MFAAYLIGPAPAVGDSATSVDSAPASGNA